MNTAHRALTAYSGRMPYVVRAHFSALSGAERDDWQELVERFADSLDAPELLPAGAMRNAGARCSMQIAWRD